MVAWTAEFDWSLILSGEWDFNLRIMYLQLNQEQTIHIINNKTLQQLGFIV
jgi:hypothetical protein